jgi:hypothetical protein
MFSFVSELDHKTYAKSQLLNVIAMNLSNHKTLFAIYLSSSFYIFLSMIVFP